MKQQSGNHVWMKCSTLADRTLLPQPTGPKITSGSDDGDMMYLQWKRELFINYCAMEMERKSFIYSLLNFLIHNFEIRTILAEIL